MEEGDWITTDATNGRAQEVIPLGDVHQHTLKQCLCRPRIEFRRPPAQINCYQIRIHHSLDGRGTPTLSEDPS